MDFISEDELNSTAISFCENTFAKKARYLKVGQALQEIREGKYESLIETMRDPCIPPDTKKHLKRNLKAYVFGGVFDYRNRDSLLDYSCLCILDFDNIGAENIADAKNQLFDDPYICAAWVSPRGEGIKALISFSFHKQLQNLPSEELFEFHKFAYNQFRNYLEEQYPYPLDKSGPDVTRLCYTSFDRNMKIKKKAQRFKVNLSEFQQPKYSIQRIGNKDGTTRLISENNVMNIQRPSNQSARRIIKSITKFLSKRGLSITEKESDWYIVGQAIANDFSYSIGKEYYLRLCRLDGNNHSEIKSVNKIISCYAQSLNREKAPAVRISRIMEFAIKKGWRGS